MSDEANAAAPWKPAFNSLVDETVAALKRGQQGLLSHYWELGGLVARFTSEAESGRLGHLTLRAFAEGLRDRGQEVSVTQLTQARRIHDRYQQSDLPELIAKGFTISHLKALLPLPEGIRETVEANTTDDQGRIAPTRAVHQAVRAARIASMADIPDSDEALPEAHDRAARTISLATPLANGLEDGGPRTIPAPTLPDSDGPKVGAVAHRDYSQPPLATVRRASAAAESLADVLPALWTTLAEVEKVGWESDTQARNFRTQAELLITAFTGLQQVAPTALVRLQSALR